MSGSPCRRRPASGDSLGLPGRYTCRYSNEPPGVSLLLEIPGKMGGGGGDGEKQNGWIRNMVFKS